MTDAARITLAIGDEPASPQAGYISIFSKSDKKVYSKNESGTVYDLSTGGSGDPDGDFHNNLNAETNIADNDETLIWDASASAYRKMTKANFVAGIGGGGEVNTASNIGTAGVGVYKQKTGVNLELKKINVGSTGVLTVTDNTGANQVDLDINVTGLTETTSADSADVILIYDNSLSAYRKMTRANFTSGLGASQGVSALAKAADYNVATGDFGKSIRVTSASQVTLSLPSVGNSEDGFRLTVVKLGAGKLIIDAADSDTIADSSAGATIYNDVSSETYASITLEYVDSATKFVVIGAHGSWTTT